MAAHVNSRELLVVDSVVERHDVYRVLLEDLVSHAEMVLPGANAARIASERPYVAVLVHLDGAGDGIQNAASLARAFETEPGVPVVLISSAFGELQAIFGAGSGSFDYMPAPIIPELLRAKVKRLVETARLRDERDDERSTVAALRSLVDEQVHRGRNLLTIIQSISMRTISDGRDLGEARGALMGRLRALSRAYEFLTVARARGVDLTDIVAAGLGDMAERVRAAGPPVRLSGSFAQTFALALHELATNAVRYGALCTPVGAVTLGWAFLEDKPDLEVGWTERGGPFVPAVPSYGFGLTLVSSLAPAPSIEFGPEGFACRLRLPNDVIVRDMV